MTGLFAQHRFVMLRAYSSCQWFRMDRIKTWTPVIMCAGNWYKLTQSLKQAHVHIFIRTIESTALWASIRRLLWLCRINEKIVLKIIQLRKKECGQMFICRLMQIRTTVRSPFGIASNATIIIGLYIFWSEVETNDNNKTWRNLNLKS